MATFKVYGAQADTGKEVQIRLQAESPSEAEAIASHRRIMVERVVEMETEAAPVAVLSAASPSLARVAQPTSRVSGHSPSAPTVNVNIPKSSSSLGIVSLILGAIALLVCWIPFIGMLAIPIGGLGLLMAGIGFFVAMSRKGGIGWPIGGGLLSAIALLVGLLQATIIGGTAKAISDAAQRQQQTNQRSVSPTGGILPRAADPKAPEEQAIQWASAATPVRQGDTEVRIASASIAPVPLKDYSGDIGTSKEAQLIVQVELRNMSATKKLDYRSWAGADISIDNDYASLRDNFGNTYKRVTFGMMHKPTGRVESDSIYPGKSISDVLVFEPPLSNAEYLNLELPGENIGGEGMLRVRIPATMIKR